MIAVDTSSWIAFLAGDQGADVEALDQLLGANQVIIPYVVLTEILSSPTLAPSQQDIFRSIPRLEITEGYWIRAGLLRAKLLKNRRKARLADTLIATACMDHHVALLTRDRDFKHFVPFGLKLWT